MLLLATVNWNEMPKVEHSLPYNGNWCNKEEFINFRSQGKLYDGFFYGCRLSGGWGPWTRTSYTADFSINVRTFLDLKKVYRNYHFVHLTYWSLNESIKLWIHVESCWWFVFYKFSRGILYFSLFKKVRGFHSKFRRIWRPQSVFGN